MKMHPRGYIALISILLISTSLIIAVISLSFTGYLNRFVILDSQLKDESLGHAEACADYAIGELTRNQSYSPSNAPIDINGDADIDCYVESVTDLGSTSLIVAKNNSVLNKSITRIEVVFNPTTPAVISWNEIP